MAATADSDSSIRLDLWRRSARGVGVVALVFSAVVGVLITTDWMRAGQAQTVRSDRLGQVLAAARQTPTDNEAVALGRDMDQLARHAYFSSVTFRTTGTWLLVGGLLVAMTCLHFAARLGRRIADPRRFPPADQARADREARIALLAAGVGGVLLLACWGAGHGTKLPPVPVATPGAGPAMHPTNAAAAVSPPQPFPAAVSNWNCFRGPRWGVAWETNAPVAWDGRSGSGIVWRTPLTKVSASSPVVWNNTVYLTEADKVLREVVAFDGATGKELWRQSVTDGGPNDELPVTSEDGSPDDTHAGYAACTPACDEAGVYAAFGTGDLAAFSHAGKLLWQIYLRRPDKNKIYGHASSLWVQDGLICVQYDQKEDGRVLAVRAKTGEIAWEQERTADPSWCSPIVVPGADGRPVLVIGAPEKLDGFDLAKGTPLWSVPGVSGEVAPSPAYWDGHVIVAEEYAPMLCYQLAAQPKKVWEYGGRLPDVASPVAADGLVYVALSSGNVTCIDAANGQEVWKHDFPTGFYASPTVCGDRLYAFDREGTMRVLAAGRTFREIAASALHDGADATPAFAGSRIYLRTKNALWCVGAK
jgi:outer membrane protein assembly factor BamB